MRRLPFVIILMASFLLGIDVEEAHAKANAPANYVVFYAKGDCHQEDCIALLKDSLVDDQGQPEFLSLDATSLAAHQTVDYKEIKITFKDIKSAPYADVMQKIAALGYHVVSYAIHDLHTGHDVIIPH